MRSGHCAGQALRLATKPKPSLRMWCDRYACARSREAVDASLISHPFLSICRQTSDVGDDFLTSLLSLDLFFHAGAHRPAIPTQPCPRLTRADAANRLDVHTGNQPFGAAMPDAFGFQRYVPAPLLVQLRKTFMRMGLRRLTYLTLTLMDRSWTH